MYFDDDELIAELQRALQDKMKDAMIGVAKKALDDLLADTERQAALMERLMDSDEIRRHIWDHFRQCVANEVGNRLRCGVYNGVEMTKLFESVWSEQLERAMGDRIRSRITDQVDAIIKERVNAALGKL